MSRKSDAINPVDCRTIFGILAYIGIRKSNRNGTVNMNVIMFYK